MAQGGGSVTLTGPLGTPATIPELAEAYDASRGLLRPTPPLPAGAGKKAGGGAAPKRLVAGVTAAAASLTPGFISGLEELAAEYGDEGGWPDLVLDTDSDSEEQDGQAGGEGGEEDGEGRIGGGGDAASASAALRRMWCESRRFLANRRLRRQKAMEVERLKRFHIHLHKLAAGEQAQGQAGPGAKAQGQANGRAAAAPAAAAVAGGKPGDKRKR